MDDQRLGVADIRQKAEDLDAVDQLPASLEAALDAEGDDSPEPPREVLGRLLM